MADRKRKTNWSSEECVVLVDKCVENTATVTGKFTKQLSAHIKKDFWANTCETINASGMCNRSVPEVMKKWAEMKSKAKQAEQKRRSAVRKTGGGPPPPTMTDIDEKIVSIIPTELLDGIAMGEDTFVSECVVSEKNEDSIGPDEAVNVSDQDEENKSSETLTKKGHKRAKISETVEGCMDLINIEKEILEESKTRNSLLRDIAEKMDTMIILKKKKLDLLEKQVDTQNEARLTELMFET